MNTQFGQHRLLGANVNEISFQKLMITLQANIDRIERGYVSYHTELKSIIAILQGKDKIYTKSIHKLCEAFLKMYEKYIHVHFKHGLHN